MKRKIYWILGHTPLCARDQQREGNFYQLAKSQGPKMWQMQKKPTMYAVQIDKTERYEKADRHKAVH